MTKKSFFVFLLLILLAALTAGIFYLGTSETPVSTEQITITIPNERFFKE